MEKLATIGVFGGSGFYKFLDNRSLYTNTINTIIFSNKKI